MATSPRQTIFERSMGDHEAPFKAVLFLDGRKSGEGTVIERKLYDKPLDDKLFSKP